MTQQSQLFTYMQFNSTLEYLGISQGKIEGIPVKVIDFTDENQMVRAGKRVIEAVKLDPSNYTREAFAEVGGGALRRLCVTSYPHIFGENIPDQIYFRLSDPELPEASTLSKVYRFILELLSTLKNSLPQRSQSKWIEDMEMQELSSREN